jgi:hypothetical protein
MKSLRCAGTGGECPPEASNVQVPQKPDSGPAGDEGKVANGKIAQAAG